MASNFVRKGISARTFDRHNVEVNATYAGSSVDRASRKVYDMAKPHLPWIMAGEMGLSPGLRPRMNWHGEGSERAAQTQFAGAFELAYLRAIWQRLGAGDEIRKSVA